jgi:hypothetical protein
VLLVASRPSTIALADDVVYLAGGAVVAHGTHEQLMDSVAAYRALVEAFEADRAPTAGAGQVGGPPSGPGAGQGDGQVGEEVVR